MATANQKKVLEKIVKDVRKGTKVSVSRAMRESGVYSESMSKKPEKLTRSKGWKELLDEYLPEKLLTQVHKDGLKATLTKFTPEGELIRVEDYATRHKYLDTGYKVRGRLKEDPQGQTVNVNIIYTPEQRKRIADRELNQPEGAGESDRLLNSNQPEV